MVLVAFFVIGFAYSASAGVAPDEDGDAIPDVLDKCKMDSRNSVAPSTCDTDCDGYGNVCDADFNQNGSVNPIDFSDFFIPVFKGFASATHGEDMNCNGVVNPIDFSDFFIPKFKGANGGSVSGPSGLSCAGTPGCGCGGCLSCHDCASGNQACVNGACGGCTSDDQCCAPRVCVFGSCDLIIPP